MKVHSIEANGIVFRCAVDGPEGAPWLTLCHSLATDLRLWDPQMEMLTGCFRVLRYDMRGHGQTDAPAGPYDWATLVGDVVALWDALAVERSHFVGLSMGGMTGMGLALEHGARLESLTCCDCRADAPGFFRSMWDERQASARAGGMAGVLDATLATWFSGETLAAGGARMEAVTGMILGTPLAGYLGATDALKALDYKNSLSRIGTPTHFIVGANDGPHPAEMLALSELVQGARYSVVESAGHLSNWEQPEAFNDVLLAFLDGGS